MTYFTEYYKKNKAKIRKKQKEWRERNAGYRRGSASFSLRCYAGEVFAVRCTTKDEDASARQWTHVTPREVYWLDGEGHLVQGTSGLLDCLEAAPAGTGEAPELWEAIRRKFGRARNRLQWMAGIDPMVEPTQASTPIHTGPKKKRRNSSGVV